MDWQSLSVPTEERIILFRKEIMIDIFNMMYAEYREYGEDSSIVATFLHILSDFPELKQLFDQYYTEQCTNKTWSNKTIMLRFVKKLIILYEDMEFRFQNV